MVVVANQGRGLVYDVEQALRYESDYDVREDTKLTIAVYGDGC